MDEPKVTRAKTFSLRLSRFELLHLRDLFSVALPPDLTQTVSQALAATEERPLVEARLWQKVLSACNEAALPTGDEAPDFIAAAIVTPAIGVMRLAHDPDQQPKPAEGEEADDPAAQVFASHEAKRWED